MKVSVNPKAKKILDIYTSLPQEKKEALEKIVEAYAKESKKDDEDN